MWYSEVSLVLDDGILENACIEIEDGRIGSFREGDGPAGAMRLGGLRVFPGMVDLHGDMLERELHPRPSANIPSDIALFELDKKLAANGITTAYAAISFAWHKADTFRSEDQARHLITLVNEQRPHLLTDHYVHTRFEITNPEAGGVLHELLDQDLVHLVSVMDHTPGQGQYRDIEAFVKFSMKWAKEKEGVDVTEEMVRAHIATAQERPKAWDAVQSIADVAPQHEVHLASHDDDSAEKVEMMAGFGVRISEFPVTLEAGQKAKEMGFHVVMGAPNALRGSSHSGNLSASEAISLGIVDTLATDYYPPAMLHSVYAIVERGILPLHEAIKLVAANPADAMDLDDRGSIAPGKNADLVFVDESQRPRVRGTMRNGVPIFWDDYMCLHTGVATQMVTALGTREAVS